MGARVVCDRLALYMPIRVVPLSRTDLLPFEPFCHPRPELVIDVAIAVPRPKLRRSDRRSAQHE